MIAFVGSREELGIGSGESALEAVSAASTDEGDCEFSEQPIAIEINEQEAATVRGVCLSATGVDTIMISVRVLKDDRGATLVGLVAANSEDELLPVVEAIFYSFQLKQW